MATTLLAMAAPAISQQSVPANGLALEWVYAPKDVGGTGVVKVISTRGPIGSLRFTPINNAVIRISARNRGRVIGVLRYLSARSVPMHGQPPLTYVDHALVLRAPTHPGARALVEKWKSLRVWVVQPRGATRGVVEIQGIPAQVWSLSIRAEGPGGSFFSTADCDGGSPVRWRATARIATGHTGSRVVTTANGGDCSSA